MKRKASLLILSSAALMLGAFAVFANARHTGIVKTEAADYNRTDKSFVLHDDSSISATFNVTNNTLDMKGWLLCLYSAKPAYNESTYKITGDIHPQIDTNCAHYFFVANTAKTGAINVTWAANLDDQKELWSDTGSTGTENKTLADYIDDEEDWYIVIGPRHYNTDWRVQDDEHEGAGKNGYWENSDYYVGKKSSLVNGVSGQTYLDLNGFDSWKADSAKFAFYYWDDNAHNGWSEFATDADNDNIYIASYEVDFIPTHMKVARLSNACVTPTWDDPYKWNETSDHVYHEFGVVGVTGSDNSSWTNSLAALYGLDKGTTLNYYKRNDSNHSEHYSDHVSLTAGDEFVVGFKDADNAYHTYNSFETNKKLDSNFVLNEGKIHVNTSGTYSLYFDTTSNSLYITTAALAEVDAWATTFLGENCTATKTNWVDSDSNFDSLSDDAQNILLEEKHYTHDETVSSLLERAVQRYDYVIELYGTESYEDFIGRVDKHNLVPSSLKGSSTIVNQGSNMGLLLALIAISSITLAFTVVMVARSKGKNK